MKQEIVSFAHNKGEILHIKLTNASGAYVVLSNLGAGVVSLVVPDKNGNFDDVLLGYENAEDYFYDGPFAGKIPGRYANRIAKGQFTIDGNTYQLAINNGPNALHGGPESFANKLWHTKVMDHAVKFVLNSPDGEEGYPGNMTVEAIYSWNDNNELSLDLRAVSDKKTVVNLTNHSYFNLDGHASGCVLNHKLTLYASRYLPTDDTLVPLGDYASVEGTPMDFTTAKTLGEDINAEFPALIYGKGYDNCWVIDNWTPGKICKVARLEAENSGRVLEIESTQPAAQVYTGNWLTGSPMGKGGVDYHDYDCVAVECQGMPDAPNQPNFPCQLLCPGEEYKHSIIYKFKLKN